MTAYDPNASSVEKLRYCVGEALNKLHDIMVIQLDHDDKNYTRILMAQREASATVLAVAAKVDENNMLRGEQNNEAHFKDLLAQWKAELAELRERRGLPPPPDYGEPDAVVPETNGAIVDGVSLDAVVEVTP